MSKLADAYYEIGYKVDNSGLMKADKGLKKIGKSALGAEDDVSKLSKVLDFTETGLVSVGAIIGTLAYGINKATNEFALFDDQLRKVNAKGDMTTKSYEKLKKAAFDAGKDTRFTATESAKGLEYMAMAGWSATESVKALPASLNMAVVAGEDLALVTDIMTDQMTVFDLGADKANHFADVLAYSANKANTSIGQMGETLKFAGAPAKALGADVEEVSALIMSMADGGVKGSQAGTALRTAYLNLASPTKEAQRTIRKLKLETKDSNGNFVGMTNILDQLSEKTKDMTNVQKSQVFQTLFGKEAITGMMVVQAQGTKKLKENTKALKENNGYAKKAADYMNNSLQGALYATTSKQEALRLAIGETFAPARLELAKTYNGILDNMLTKLSDSSEETQKLSDFTVGFVSIMSDGMAFIGKAIKDSVILPLQFVGNTLDILTLGQFSKAKDGIVDHVAEIGEQKRAESEFQLAQMEKANNPNKKEDPVVQTPLRKEKDVNSLELGKGSQYEKMMLQTISPTFSSLIKIPEAKKQDDITKRPTIFNKETVLKEVQLDKKEPLEKKVIPKKEKINENLKSSNSQITIISGDTNINMPKGTSIDKDSLPDILKTIKDQQRKDEQKLLNKINPKRR